MFYGHPNVRAFHGRTIELTKMEDMSLRADCIIGVRADKGCIDLSEDLKTRLQEENSYVRMVLIVGDYAYEFTANGTSRLRLSHGHDIVIRKSNFVCPRTLAINANHASDDIPREIVSLLKSPNTKGCFRIMVE